jgi:hypothetical protein
MTAKVHLKWTCSLTLHNGVTASRNLEEVLLLTGSSEKWFFISAK